MIIALIISSDYSELYSGAKTRQLASIIFDEMTKLLNVSPVIKKWFTMTSQYIRNDRTKSKFTTVSSEANNSNGTRPQIFMLDEVATQTKTDLWDALKLGQFNLVDSPLAISISTAYLVPNNIFKVQCQHLKDVLDKKIEDEWVFGMLFELDEEDYDNWTDEELWWKATPVQMSDPEGFEKIKRDLQIALSMGGSTLSEFQAKMFNMWISDAGVSSFITIDDLRKCELKNEFDWHNRKVYIGLDLSLRNDNTCVCFVTYDKNLKKYVMMAKVFVPEDYVDEKSTVEKVNYRSLIRQGYVISCNEREINKTISHKLVTDYIMNTVKQYNLTVDCIISDNYDVEIIRQYLSDKGYKFLIQKQYNKDLNDGIKRLQEALLNQDLLYEFNPMIELNFSGAKANYDSYNCMYIDKKKSTFKIDVVDAVINCFCKIVNDERNSKSIYETPRRAGFIVI